MRNSILSVVAAALLLCLALVSGARAEWVIKYTIDGAMYAAPALVNTGGGWPDHRYYQADMNGDGRPDALVFRRTWSNNGGLPNTVGDVGIADIGAAQTTWLTTGHEGFCDQRIPPFYLDCDSDGLPDVAVQIYNMNGGVETLIIGWSAGAAAVANPTAPAASTLHQNRPNPSAGNTTIEFTLATKSQVRLAIYDVSGRLVSQLVDGALAAGSYAIPWNGHDSVGNPIAAGSYFYQLTVDGREDSKRMVVIR